MPLLRRHLIALGALSPWVTPHAFAQKPGPRNPRWIVVLLRGAVDGLSVCAPYAEAAYREDRPSIALAPPGQDGGLLDLDGHFGLHPALAPLEPLWRAGQFGFVHASGQPGGGRSHFEAQDELEAGGVAVRSGDGWMARLARPLAEAGTVRALYSATVRPKLLAGFDGSAALPGASRGADARPPRSPLGDGLERLYAQDPRYAEHWKAGQMGREQVAQAMSAGAQQDAAMGMGTGEAQEMQAADRGAPASGTVPATARRLAQALRADPRLQFAALEVGGWDTHARQGAAQGQLANRLAPLGQGLATLARELGPLWQDTVVTVLSEFGRTVRENGNGGTDHGHGNAAWLLGGRVAGGRVLGAWPTLDASARYQGRDLAITTDVRAVLSGIAARHLGLGDAALSGLFPGFAGAPMAVMRG